MKFLLVRVDTRGARRSRGRGGVSSRGWMLRITVFVKSSYEDRESIGKPIGGWTVFENQGEEDRGNYGEPIGEF